MSHSLLRPCRSINHLKPKTPHQSLAIEPVSQPEPFLSRHSIFHFSPLRCGDDRSENVMTLFEDLLYGYGVSNGSILWKSTAVYSYVNDAVVGLATLECVVDGTQQVCGTERHLISQTGKFTLWDEDETEGRTSIMVNLYYSPISLSLVMSEKIYNIIQHLCKHKLWTFISKLAWRDNAKMCSERAKKSMSELKAKSWF